MTLAQATQQADSDGANYIKGLFADRITADGSFPAQLEDDIWQQFPLCTDVTERVCDGCPKKIVAIKGPTPVGGGHHIFDDAIPTPYYKPWAPNAWIHHFKWWGPNPEQFFWDRFDEQGLYRTELVLMLEHLRKHDGIDTTNLRQLDTEQVRLCQTP
jgi:hypothetical protein